MIHYGDVKMENIIITKKWAMANAKTFSIKPIKEIVEREVFRSEVIVDPFANECKYGTITNDLNPEYDTKFHLDALSFLKQIESESADLVLYDPPYSFRQATECYKGFGKEKLKEFVQEAEKKFEIDIDKVRKETAREIFEEIHKKEGYYPLAMVGTSQNDMIEIAKIFGIKYTPDGVEVEE